MEKAFHAVSIVARAGCACTAVSLIENVRYLSNEAPMIPLAACETPSACRCTYRHYRDRRDDKRRDADAGLAGRPYYAQERRRLPGRRANDLRRATRSAPR
jgi:hypothetical protein